MFGYHHDSSADGESVLAPGE